ncbi:MAG: hypothetical protein SWJ54_24915, partial [Cyanobacteriota bacterium]|nr:hypothetical protein [Cyanobacteriota bacterium]
MKTALIQEKPGKIKKREVKTSIEDSQELSAELQDQQENLETLNPFSEWEDNPFDVEDVAEIDPTPHSETSGTETAKSLRDILDAQPEVPPQAIEETEKPKDNVSLTPQIGLSLLAILGCVYVMTRPCVIGECQVIDAAKQQAAKSEETIKNVTTSQAPGIAKQELDGAIKQLNRIPFWSPYHRQARALASAYKQDSNELDSVVKALWNAGLAVKEGQEPPYEVEKWDQIKTRWEKAIAQLEAIPPENSVYPFAQDRLKQYRANLA